MADRYWVGGTASWDGFAATKWSTSSGGPGGASLPTTADRVFFTNLSTGTCTITAGNTGAASIDCTGFTGTIAGTANITVAGSVTLSAGMTFTHTGFKTISGTGTITTAGKTFGQLAINGAGITVTLGDNLNCGNSGMLLTAGTFDAVSYNVTAFTFASNNANTRTLKLGSGLWTISGAAGSWNLTTTTNLTFDKGTANIIFTGTTFGTITFNGGGLTYNKLTIGGTGGTVGKIYNITGNNTFSEIASTKTVSATIGFAQSSNTTITNWTASGTAGNVLTVQSAVASLPPSLTITNRTFGIDYLDVRNITANSTPVTFYAGPNSVLRGRTSGVAARNAVSNEFIYVLHTGTSFTVPSDWDNSNNEIHLFAGGGGGAGGYVSGANRAAGAGGGGGGYTKLTNLPLVQNSSVSYAIGAAGAAGAANANGTTGGATTFNAGAHTTTGGGGGQASTAPSSTGGAAGTGSTNSGGVGGAGATSTVTATGAGSGGGGGAGGPLGTGAKGGNGFASTTAANVSGGGGGGNGGGTNGGNASSATYAPGGNNNAGVGGGSGAGVLGFGFNGGGGGGSLSSASGMGGAGIDIVNARMGGGGGMGGAGNSIVANSNAAGFFGGGGSGGGVTTANAVGAGGAGAQGGIIIWYISGPPQPQNTGNFFFMFN